MTQIAGSGAVSAGRDAPSASASAPDWPQWRGPQRDGVWREDRIITRFNSPQVPIVWRAEIGAGIAVIDLLVKTGLSASKGEARRLVRGGGARLNDKAVSDEALTASASDLSRDGTLKLSAGRKRHVLVRPT